MTFRTENSARRNIALFVAVLILITAVPCSVYADMSKLSEDTMGAAMLTAGASNINEASIVYGDASGDSVVNTTDLAMLRSFLASKDPVTGESSVEVADGADANGDGKTDTIDLAMLRKYLASIDPVTGESTVVLGPETVAPDEGGDGEGGSGGSSGPIVLPDIEF